MGVRRQIVHLLDPRAAAQDAKATKDLTQRVASCRQQRVNVRCPLVDATLEVVENTTLAQHIRRAGEAGLDWNQTDVVDRKALVTSALVQCRRHPKHRRMTCVVDVFTDLLNKLWRATSALLVTTSSAPRPRPYLDAVQQHLCRLAIPCVQRNEVKVDAKHVVRHRDQIIRPLEVHALTAVLDAA